MLYEASKDGYLESKELKKWCKHNCPLVLFWFKTIMMKERNQLVKEGLIEEQEVVGTFREKKYIETSELKKEAIELAGLKRYLNEYTLIKQREAIEVQLFEEYLIFAQIMGISKKVAKQFKDIYPEVIQQSNFRTYNNIMFINMSFYRGTSAARTTTSKIGNYSSGGGGFSSGGGGGGSFGGGGGGRRLPLKLNNTKVFDKYLPKMGIKDIIKTY